ncbi:MAG: helix-turn-helix transcriptional regulator [Pseudomonadota bacterium]
MSISFEDVRDKMLQNPKVAEAYEQIKPEYDVAEALIAARLKSNLSQAEVAKRMHTTQSVVARLESGRHLPSLQTIYRYAHAVNRRISLNIFP